MGVVGRLRGRFAVFYVLVITIALIASLYANRFEAQSEPPSELPSNPVTVEVSSNPVNFSMTIDKTIFNLGEPVDMTFRLENIGNKTLTLVFSDGHESFSYIVYNASWSEVYELELAFAQVYEPMQIPPGEFTWMILSWYQQGSNIGERVPSGAYNIVGLFPSRTLGFTIETPPITIEIVG